MRKTWVEDIIEAFVALGGDAQYSDLYQYIERNGSHQFSEISNPRATIRAEVERKSSDSKKFKGVPNSKDDLFISVEGVGKGHWGLRNYQPLIDAPVDLSADDPGFSEGKFALREHLKLERNISNTKKVKETFLNKHGSFYCEVCGFSYSEKYQENIALDFIEVHALIAPNNKKTSQLSKNDFVLVCSNCHQMLHRYRPFITEKKNLRKILN